MATLVLRGVKGSPLTATEVDANFSNINSEVSTKAPIATPTFTGTVTLTTGSLGVTGSNQGLEIGSTTAANSPFVDFHSSGNAIDYDARIISTGGTASIGAATLTYNAATHTFNGNHNVIGTQIVNSTIYSGFLTDVGADNITVENTSVLAGVTKFVGQNFKGRDTSNVSKSVGSLRVYPSDNNYASSFFSWFGRAADVVAEKMRLYGAGRLVIGSSLTDNGTDTLQVNGTINISTPLGITSGGSGSATATGTGSIVLAVTPTFTGAPISTTPTIGDNSTRIATTSFVTDTTNNTSVALAIALG